ncbi:MAG: phosphoribosyltransferase family protein [Bryobacteraceae bacterium]|nr:phosphoribosyltransferase family protein [Bryobacteraceae bacterium]MDW8379308.1 phosphoribosyltransferase family protein [Bryobacterales bacterium]
MDLVPSQQDVIKLLEQTGALRRGHFVYPNGLHADEYLQVSLAMRHYEHLKTLSVGLSRKVRQNPELRAMIPQLSIVAPAGGGVPVAYGVCEALRAKQVYWAESNGEDTPLHFRQYFVSQPGEKVLLVDDIFRSGKRLSELKSLVEANGGEVVGLAVMVYQPTPRTPDFGNLPLFYLAKLDAHYSNDADSCLLCRQGLPLETVWV